MHRYPLNGRPTAFFRGDWFVGKGVACAALRIGPAETDVLEVLNTHLHAPYEREPNDSYICHRTAQAWEIAKLARAAREKGRLVLAVGDFNMVPASLAHAIVTTHGGVKDAWREVRPESSVAAAGHEAERSRGRPVPSVEFNMKINGTTCDSLANTWRMPKEVQRKVGKGRDVLVDWQAEDRRGKRLDYVFFSKDSAGGGLDSDSGSRRRWTVSRATLGMTMRHPTLDCSLSDHFAVEATLTLSESSAPSPATAVATEDPVSDLLSTSTYDSILDLIHRYFSREYRQRRFRLWHFGSSIVISIGCFIAIWWSPHNFVSFILLLLSTLGFGAGVLDGLIGGLFVGSELRALREFEWEVRNTRAMAEAVEKRPESNGNIGKG